MPVISDLNYCIDRRSLEFSLIKKELYKDLLFNNKIAKTKRYFHKYLKNIIFLRRLVQVEMRDVNDWEIYPSGNKEYIFISVAKAASSSINISLNHFLYPEPKFHHMGIKEIKNYFPSLDISKYYKFAFVRNPWDRFLSLYNDMTLQRNGNKRVMNYSLLENKYRTIFHKKKNFKEFAKSFESSSWLNEAHFKSQFEYLSINGELSMDFIGRFENLNNDWAHIRNELGLNYLDALSSERESKIKINNYRDCYDDETAEIVARIYRKDIELFEYKF